MDDSNSEVEVVSDATGFTRRDFIAGASAAGAVLLGASSAGAVDDPPPDDEPVKVTTRPPAHVHTPRPTCVAATPDGRVVTCDDGGGVYLRVLAPASKTPFKKLRKTKASYVTVSRTGNRVFTACFDGVVAVSDLLNQRRLAVFDDHLAETGPNTEVWAVAVNANGTKAVSGTNAGEIRYWDVATVQSAAQVVGDGEPVTSLAFFPGDETKVLSGHGDGKMILWNYTANGLQQAATFDQLKEIKVNSIAAFENNGPKAMTASFDGHVRLWDLSNPNLPPTVLPIEHTHFVWRVAVTPDGKTFASAGEDHKVQVFRLNGDQVANPAIAEDGGVMGVAFVSNTRVVYTTGSLADPQVKYADFPAAP